MENEKCETLKNEKRVHKSKMKKMKNGKVNLWLSTHRAHGPMGPMGPWAMKWSYTSEMELRLASM